MRYGFIKILSIALLLLWNVSCVKEYDCKGFDIHHPIMIIAPSSELKQDVLKFVNDNQDTITFVRKSVYSSGIEAERCGLTDDVCNCYSYLQVVYSDSILGNDIYSYFEDNYLIASKSHYVDVSISFNRAYFEFRDIDYYNVSTFIDSLTNEQTDSEGQVFEDIIEFENTNSDESEISKLWIKPGFGLFRIWIDDIEYRRLI